MKSDAEPGNGDQVNRCILEVYLIDGDDAALYGSREMVKVENLKASFEDLNLITGQKYRFVLWADYVDNPETVEGLAVDKFYNTDEAGGLQNVTMVTVTSDYAGNNDQRDAFFYTGEVTVEGPKDYTLELKRPFGQLNIITTDYGLIPETHKDLRPARVQLAYKSIPTGINLLTGELLSTTDGSVTVQEVEGQAVPITDLSVAGNEDARQLSFDYMMPDNCHLTTSSLPLPASISSESLRCLSCKKTARLPQVSAITPLRASLSSATTVPTSPGPCSLTVPVWMWW